MKGEKMGSEKGGVRRSASSVAAIGGGRGGGGSSRQNRGHLRPGSSATLPPKSKKNAAGQPTKKVGRIFFFKNKLPLSGVKWVYHSLELARLFPFFRELWVCGLNLDIVVNEFSSVFPILGLFCWFMIPGNSELLCVTGYYTVVEVNEWCCNFYCKSFSCIKSKCFCCLKLTFSVPLNWSRFVDHFVVTYLQLPGFEMPPGSTV